MLKKTNSTIISCAIAAALGLALTGCGGGTQDASASAGASTATPTPAPVATPTPAPTPSNPTRVSKMPSIYYYDDAGQWHLMPGVTVKQAHDAGVMCTVRASEATRNAYIAAGRTVEWVDANITSSDLCAGY